MSIDKRGNVWWLDGWFEGRRYQVSTKHKNKKRAEKFGHVFIANLADERGGIVKRKPAPLFSDFAKRFVEHFEVRHNNKPQTVAFYAAKLSRLLEYSPIASARLDKVNESLIEQYVISRRAIPVETEQEPADRRSQAQGEEEGCGPSNR